MKEGVRPTSPASAAEEPIVFVIDDDPLMLGGLSSLFRSIGLRARDRKRRAEEKSNSDARARFALLTPRERQIMALVTGGLMNKQVAGKIGISERTVKTVSYTHLTLPTN